MAERYTTFHDFYPFYLAEHANPTCRRLHVIGSTLVVLVFVAALLTQHWLWLIALPVIGYGFAWIGHFFFEHNRPATFTHPLYSLVGDWVMWWQVISGRRKF
jgi:hypothetical protein